MGLVEGVLQRGINNCTHDEIEAAYVEHFGFPPCQSCTGAKKYTDAYNALYKSVNKLTKIISMKPKTDQKYYWNPEKKGVTVYLSHPNGRGSAHSGNETNQDVLERIFNQPRRAGIVLLNPDYKEAGKEAVVKTLVDNKPEALTEDQEKDLCKKLASEGLTVNKIHKKTGIAYHKVKKYINE